MSAGNGLSSAPSASRCSTATDWDHRIIDATSIALGGVVGGSDDVARLMREIQVGPNPDKLKVACEIAVAFIRWSQDLKDRR